MKVKNAVFAVGVALVSLSANADTGSIVSANNQLGIQAISTHVDYTETGSGTLGSPTGTLDSEKGDVPGYALSVSFMRNWLTKNDYMRLQYSHNQGNTNYVGQLTSGGGYGSVVGTSSASMDDYSARYGFGYELGEKSMLTPYLEIGRHKWERNVTGQYMETYEHNYYGIGLLGQYTPADQWVLSANAMYGHTTDSHINVPLVGLNTSLGNSTMYQLGLSADYAVTKNFHANIGVDYSEFKYGMSAINAIGGYYVWEPDSKTKYTTYKVGVAYAF